MFSLKVQSKQRRVKSFSHINRLTFFYENNTEVCRNLLNCASSTHLGNDSLLQLYIIFSNISWYGNLSTVDRNGLQQSIGRVTRSKVLNCMNRLIYF